MIEFRRHLRQLFGVPVRAEIKANYLLRNGGPFRPLGLSESARFGIYRQSMRLHAKIGLKTFAVVIDKARLGQAPAGRTPDSLAWEYMLQRLERFTTRGSTWVMLVHDEGNEKAVRTFARKARRAGSAGSMLGTGFLHRPFTRLVDDPVSRDSAQSYFVQLADLSAYAAFRRLYPPPQRPVQIVPQTMWDELGQAAFAPANRYSGGPPGIVSA